MGRVILALILLILALSALASAASDSNPNGRVGGFVIALGLGLGGAALLLSGLRRYFGAGMSSPRPPTAMKKCPFCAEDIRIAAIVCKHCGRDVPTAAAEVQIAQTKKKSLPVARGCAIFVILSSVVIVIAVKNMYSGNKSSREAPASAPLFPRAPETPPVKVEPAIQIRKYVGLAPSQLYSVFRKDLGPNAGVKREKLEGEWSGFARFKGGHLEIFEENGRIDTISVFFDTPVKDYMTALALLGLDPYKTPTWHGRPGSDYIWKHEFEGIGEVRALGQVGSPTIRGVQLFLFGFHV